MTREIGTVHDRVEERLAPPANAASDTLQHYRTGNLPYEGLRPQGPAFGDDHIMIPPLYPPGEPVANPAASYPTASNPPSDTGPQKTATNPAAAAGQDYVVQPNNNLWKISEQSLASVGNQSLSPGQISEQVQNIIRANQQDHPELLTNPNLIFSGSTLHIPTQDNPGDAPPPPTAPPTSPGDTPAPPAAPPTSPGDTPAPPATPPASPGDTPAPPATPPASPGDTPAPPAAPPASPGDTPAPAAAPPASPGDTPAPPAAPPASPGDTPAPPAAPPTSPGDTPSPPAAPPTSPGGQDYVVQPKDSLWKIAEKSLGGTGNQKASPGQIWHQVQNIIQANKSDHPELLKNPDLIHAGLKLHIPTSDNPPGSPSPNKPAQPTTPEIPPGSPAPDNPAQPTSPEHPPDKPSPPGAPVPGDTAQRILAAAACDVDQQEWRRTAGGSSGAHLGCAASVSSVLRQAGVASVNETGVEGLKDALIRQGWTVTNTPAPGDVVMGYGGLSKAHTGIVGPNGTAWANRSSTGQWKPNSLSYFTNNWDRVFYLRPPQA